MNERLRLVGGALTLTSSAGQGTAIEAVVALAFTRPGSDGVHQAPGLATTASPIANLVVRATPGS